MRTHLNDPNLRTVLFAIMVKRLGGTVTINQDDINDVAYDQLIEKGNDDHSLTFTYVQRVQT